MYVFYTNQKFPPWPSVAKVVFLFTSQLQDGKFMVCIFLYIVTLSWQLGIQIHKVREKW